MKFSAIGKMCLTLANRSIFRAKKHSPELCLIGAAATGIACVIEACKATHKSEPVFAEHKEAIQEAEVYLDENPQNFSDDEKRRYVGHIYMKTGVKLVRNYAKPAALGLVSGGLVFAGYNIMRGRNLALLSALAAEKAKNLKLLEEREKKFLGSGEDEKHEPCDDQHYEEKEEKEAVESLTPDEARFKFFWGEGDEHFQDVQIYGPKANPFKIEQIETYFNRILPCKQVVTVNDILDYFKKPRIYEGQYAGWVFDPKKGEHQIDFGLRSGYKPTKMFMDGEDPKSSLYICLNADNYIIDKALPRLSDMREFYSKGGW